MKKWIILIGLVLLLSIAFAKTQYTESSSITGETISSGEYIDHLNHKTYVLNGNITIRDDGILLSENAEIWVVGNGNFNVYLSGQPNYYTLTGTSVFISVSKVIVKTGKVAVKNIDTRETVATINAGQKFEDGRVTNYSEKEILEVEEKVNEIENVEKEEEKPTECLSFLIGFLVIGGNLVLGRK